MPNHTLLKKHIFSKQGSDRCSCTQISDLCLMLSTVRNVASLVPKGSQTASKFHPNHYAYSGIIKIHNNVTAFKASKSIANPTGGKAHAPDYHQLDRMSPPVGAFGGRPDAFSRHLATVPRGQTHPLQQIQQLSGDAEAVIASHPGDDGPSPAPELLGHQPRHRLGNQPDGGKWLTLYRLA